MREPERRLSEIADKIADNVFFEEKCAKSVQRKHITSVAVDTKSLQSKDLGSFSGNGGGGIRTPVP